NYLVILVLSFIVCFLRNPSALASLALVVLGVSCCNDPFATGLNDTLLHSLRKVAPRLVARARAKAGSDGVVGLHKRRRVYIVLLPRSLVAVGLVSGGLVAVYWSHALLTLSWAILLGLGLPLLHASFRLPNLKAKIASAREEFRAVWMLRETKSSSAGKKEPSRGKQGVRKGDKEMGTRLFQPQAAGPRDEVTTRDRTFSVGARLPSTNLPVAFAMAKSPSTRARASSLRFFTSSLWTFMAVAKLSVRCDGVGSACGASGVDTKMRVPRQLK
ncbi:hypothetical protein VOLCADRAFT_115862, partial [Volvox carteri f. nagariensis]